MREVGMFFDDDDSGVLHSLPWVRAYLCAEELDCAIIMTLITEVFVFSFIQKRQMPIP